MAVTINASTTAGLVQTADTSGVLQLQTANTAALTIDGSQNVGIGTSSPGTKLEVAGQGKYNALTFAYNTSYYNQDNQISNYSSGNYLYVSGNGTSTGGLYLQGGGNQKQNIIIDGNSAGGNIAFATNGSERARIDSSGCLIVNATSKVSGTTYLSVQGSTASSNIIEQKDTGTSYATNNYYQVYYNSSNSVAGGIAHNAATTVAFNTSSDVRLKENIVDAPSVLDKVLAAQVRSFDWKEDGRHVEYGFIAQELYQHLPEAVGKGDDEAELTDAKGTWQVEYGRLTPMLLKA